VPVIVEIYTDNHSAPRRRCASVQWAISVRREQQVPLRARRLRRGAPPTRPPISKAAAIEAGANDFEALTHLPERHIPEATPAPGSSPTDAGHAVSTWLKAHGGRSETSELGHIAKTFPRW